MKSLKDSLDELEKELIQDALKETNGNRMAASRLLGVEPRTFRYKMRKHGFPAGVAYKTLLIDVDKLKDMYLKGIPFEELTAYFNCSVTTLRNRLINTFGDDAVERFRWSRTKKIKAGRKSVKN